MAAKSRKSAAPPDARFIFKGTVKQLQAVTSPGIPAADNAAIVRVDEVIQAPELLSKLGGRDITVYLGAKKIAKGEQAIFYAAGAHFGKSIAVEELDRQAVDKVPAVSLALHGRDPVKNLRARETKNRMDGADMVISGTVVAVRRIAEPTPSTPPVKRFSEHDPAWQEAVIEVGDVHKGTTGKKTIVVRFPNSTDVMWREAPKFCVGQKGVFMLHKEPGGGPPTLKAATTAAEPGEVYTALHPMDFQSIERTNVLRPFLASLTENSGEE